jgi:nucleotide-binding universal stress UspA family protein
VSENEEEMFDRLMVAFDGTAPSRRALDAGVDLAKRLGRPLRAITVLESNPIYIAAGGSTPHIMAEVQRAAESFAQELKEEVAALSLSSGVSIEYEAAYGQEVDGIVDAVGRHQIDTLIIGIRAHPGLVDRLVSHTARDLSERSPCNIIGVK